MAGHDTRQLRAHGITDISGTTRYEVATVRYHKTAKAAAASILEEMGRVPDPQLLADEAQHGRGRLPAGSDLTRDVRCQTEAR